MQDDFSLDANTDAAYGLDGQEWSTGVGEPAAIELPQAIDPADPGVTLGPEPGMPLADDPAAAPAASDAAAESAALPGEMRFGASIGPYGTTNDTYDEEYHYSTTEDRYYGVESGRTIDEYTGYEKT